MATTVRLAGLAAAALFGSLLMPAATASASALSDPLAAVGQADEHSDCGHHRGDTAALRREAAELGAQRTTVAADLADAQSRLAAATAAVAALQTQVSALHQRENYLIGELTLTGLIRRSLLIQRGFIELLPPGPEKDRRLAEWEAARAQNEARATALGRELISVREQLGAATAALDAQQQAVVALTATVASDTQQLAAIDARLAAIAVELSHDRCDPPPR
jgi:septal ring factor EnvC (AmiA/AmiB activator)